MRFTLEYPSEQPAAGDEFLLPSVLADVAGTAERAGFDAVALSEHPAPSRKWRSNGGHNTLDPIAALGYLAGVTSRIRLLTNLYVLPYHQPYLAAKALTSLDIVSGGRLTLGVGAGYLRSEFAAVGADFERRAELLDEGLRALTSMWTEPGTPVAGEGFEAPGPLWLQPPVQRPHPPIWIGGNSRAAMRRVVEHGAGWMPLITPAAFASAIRTTPIETADDFSAALGVLRSRLQQAGRDPESVDVQVVCPPTDLDDASSVTAAQDFLADMQRRGATSVVVHVDVASPTASIDYIERFAGLFVG